jgi:hypothetical protein
MGAELSWQSYEEHPLKETLEKLTGGTLEVGFHLPREKFVLAVQWQFSPRGEPLLNEGDDLACSHSSSISMAEWRGGRGSGRQDRCVGGEEEVG